MSKPELKTKLKSYVKNNVVTVQGAAKAVGISQSTAYKWLEDFYTEGYVKACKIRDGKRGLPATGYIGK